MINLKQNEGDNMEIRLLKYFLAIAREQNISKAAKYLNTTQPNLSRQLQMLEDEIGKPLFIRENKKMLLTETGLLLKKRAEEILALTEQTELELRDLDDKEISGQINIGAGESISLDIVCKTIKQVISKYPNIHFNFYSGDSEEISYKLESGLVDFAILVEPFNLDKYNHLPLPRKDKWGVIMHKDMPLANKDIIKPEDLWDKPLIISRHSKENNFITNWLQKHISELNIVSTYNLLFNASLLVKEKVGYAISFSELLNIVDTNLVCKEMSPTLTSTLHLTWKKHYMLSKPAKIFLDYFNKNIEV